MLLTRQNPGVHTTESTFGPVPVDQLGFSEMNMAGPALRGPVDKAYLITSPEAYHKLYGRRSGITYLDESIRAIYEIVTTKCRIKRAVGSGAAVAQRILQNSSTTVITVTAKGPGADYNYASGPPKKGVAVTYDATKKILRVFDYSDIDRPNDVKETFFDVDFTQFSAVVTRINNGSNLINIVWNDPTQNPADASGDQGLTGGADGSAVTASDIVTALDAFADPELDPGFLLAPGYSQATVGLKMVNIGQRFRKLPCIDSTLGIGSNIASLIAEKQQYAADQGHGVYCAQWVKQTDLDSPDGVKDVPRSPFVAAWIARSHAFPGSIANVGAGTATVYPNVTALEFDFNDLDHDELNRNGVNIARNFARRNRGIVSYSGRTISGNPLYRYLSVRVIFDIMAASIERTLIDFVFRPNDGQDRLARQIKRTIEQFRNPLGRRCPVWSNCTRRIQS
jgi:phage tail sheath protein FI